LIIARTFDESLLGLVANSAFKASFLEKLTPFENKKKRQKEGLQI